MRGTRAERGVDETRRHVGVVPARAPSGAADRTALLNVLRQRGAERNRKVTPRLPRTRHWGHVLMTRVADTCHQHLARSDLRAVHRSRAATSWDAASVVVSGVIESRECHRNRPKRAGFLQSNRPFFLEAFVSVTCTVYHGSEVCKGDQSLRSQNSHADQRPKIRQAEPMAVPMAVPRAVAARGDLAAMHFPVRFGNDKPDGHGSNRVSWRHQRRAWPNGVGPANSGSARALSPRSNRCER